MKSLDHRSAKIAYEEIGRSRRQAKRIAAMIAPPESPYLSTHREYIHIRRAAKSDCNELAELINHAGEGLPYYLWDAIAGAGKDPWEIGRQRAARDTGGFSYRHGIIAEFDAKIAGSLIGYPLAAAPQQIDIESTPPMFVPVLELEQIAAGSWYINAVATYPEARGLGIGTDLVWTAEQTAIELGLPGTSLIVSDANLGARRLYKRLGYNEVSKRPMIKEQWENEGSAWILMIKELDR